MQVLPSIDRMLDCAHWDVVVVPLGLDESHSCEVMVSFGQKEPERSYTHCLASIERNTNSSSPVSKRFG